MDCRYEPGYMRTHREMYIKYKLNIIYSQILQKIEVMEGITGNGRYVVVTQITENRK